MVVKRYIIECKVHIIFSANINLLVSIIKYMMALYSLEHINLPCLLVNNLLMSYVYLWCLQKPPPTLTEPASWRFLMFNTYSASIHTAFSTFRLSYPLCSTDLNSAYFQNPAQTHFPSCNFPNSNIYLSTLLSSQSSKLNTKWYLIKKFKKHERSL